MIPNSLFNCLAFLNPIPYILVKLLTACITGFCEAFSAASSLPVLIISSVFSKIFLDSSYHNFLI